MIGVVIDRARKVRVRHQARGCGSLGIGGVWGGPGGVTPGLGARSGSVAGMPTGSGVLGISGGVGPGCAGPGAGFVGCGCGS
jgi:hypothetical protein